MVYLSLISFCALGFVNYWICEGRLHDFKKEKFNLIIFKFCLILLVARLIFPMLNWRDEFYTLFIFLMKKNYIQVSYLSKKYIQVGCSMCIVNHQLRKLATP